MAEYDPEDTLRFHALRLHEAGLTGIDPNKIIRRGHGLGFLKNLNAS